MLYIIDKDKINLSVSYKCHKKPTKFCNCHQKVQENTGKYSQISTLIPNSLGPNPKQLLINNELTRSLSVHNTSIICTARNKQVIIIHLDKKFPTFL